jgi:hypothetical protein
MKLRFLVPCLAFALMTVAAHAQIGLYVNPVFTHISNSQLDSGPFAFLGTNTTSRMFYGANIGGYDDFFHGGKVNVGVDVRDSIVKGNNATLNSFLVGVRVVGKSTRTSLKPYVQLSGGVGTSKPPTSTVHLSRAGYAIFGGVDYPFAKHVDFRIAEVGYGSVGTVSSANYAGGIPQVASKLFSVSTGLVFRFR